MPHLSVSEGIAGRSQRRLRLTSARQRYRLRAAGCTVGEDERIRQRAELCGREGDTSPEAASSTLPLNPS